MTKENVIPVIQVIFYRQMELVIILIVAYKTVKYAQMKILVLNVMMNIIMILIQILQVVINVHQLMVYVKTLLEIFV